MRCLLLLPLLLGCTFSGGDTSFSLADDDDSYWGDCTPDAHRHSAAMAAYNRDTAIDDQTREFWEEDRRFYEARSRDDCED